MTYLNMELLSKNESELEDLENDQSLHSLENENTKGVVKQPFDKGISVDVKYGCNQLSQQRLGIEIGLYQPKLPTGTKENRK